MKVVVVGGGISGLYVALKMLQKGHNVTLFEKAERFGGRIHSLEIVRGQMVETGAGRFNTGHKRLFKLINELGLIDKVIPIMLNERRFVEEGSSLNNQSAEKYDLYVKHILYEKLVKSPWKKHFTTKYLKSVTFRVFMLEQIKNEKLVNNIIAAFGYNSEFELQNAYTSLTIMTNDFADSIQYYYMQGGLSQIINLLVKNIHKLGGKLHANTEVISYEPTVQHVVYKMTHDETNRELTAFNKIIFCVTKSVLEKFHFVANDKQLRLHLESITMAPLHRIFAKFPAPKEDVKHFLDFPFRITTTLPIRYIYPTNPTTHVGQVSYTDNDYAEYWENKSVHDVKHELFVNLKKIFSNKHVEKPIWIKRFFWKEGVTYWLPDYKVYRNSKVKPYVIAGEIMSPTHSGWIEGALHGADKALSGLL